MAKQIEGEAVSGDEVSNKFFEHGYRVKSFERGLVSVAWRIHGEEMYNVLELIIFKSTSVKSLKEDRRIVSKFFGMLHYQWIKGLNLFQGLELRRVFGVDILYYMGKQVMVVADRFLVSLSCDESGNRVDRVEIVPLSDLSSVLGGRRASVLERAERLFRPNKGEVLHKAYSRARKGLVLTMVLIALLVLLIFLNTTGTVFQILLIVDSILIVATIIASLVIHELGVIKFKNLLRGELIAFQAPPKHFLAPQEISRTCEKIQEFPKQITPASTPQLITDEKSPQDLEIEKYVEPLLTEEGNSREFYAQRRNALWDLAQNAYAEGDWDNCIYHLRGAVNSALKETYVKLTGRAAYESLQRVVEFVCEKTGLGHERFRQFFERINKPQKLSEAEFSRFFEQAQGLLTDLQSLELAIVTTEIDSVEKDIVKHREELPKKDFRDSETLPGAQRKKSSKIVKKSGKRGKSEILDSEKLVKEQSSRKKQSKLKASDSRDDLSEFLNE